MKKLIVISDTHGKHAYMRNIPDGDFLIHCGDFTNIGEKAQVIDFIEWFVSQPHQHKIFIAGNHDRSFDRKYDASPNDTLWFKHTLNYAKECGLHYLENNDVTIDGIKFWGSPLTPSFNDHFWAFNKNRGEGIKRYWDSIPEYTDVVITHGPPAHKLDWCTSGDRVGCEDLEKRIDRIKPRFHLFGHIHESHGILEESDTTFVNASCVDERYNLINKPIELKL